MFDALCLLVGGGLGLTAIENVFKTKQQVKNEAPAQKKKAVVEEAPEEPSEEG